MLLIAEDGLEVGATAAVRGCSERCVVGGETAAVRGCFEQAGQPRCEGARLVHVSRVRHRESHHVSRVDVASER